jgi:hypothetical protein
MILFEESPIDIFENEETNRIIIAIGRIFLISLPPIINMIVLGF